jgi:hypothetical protein
MAAISTSQPTTTQGQPPRGDFVLDTIKFMRGQEKLDSYGNVDYLSQCQPSSSGLTNVSLPLDADCRQQMSLWCYQVCDHAKIKREIVSIAMSFLDRFLATTKGRLCLSDRVFYKLACMTCLYTAIKTHNDEAIPPQVLSGLSGGSFDSTQIEHTELVILESLRWKLNAPTAVSFIYNLVLLVPSTLMSDESKATAIDLAKYQAEVAVNNYYFVTIQASTTALATLANAMDAMEMSIELQDAILILLVEAIEVDTKTALFQEVREQLCVALSAVGSSACRQLSLQTTPLDEMNKTTSSCYFESPRSVTATTQR